MGKECLKRMPPLWAMAQAQKFRSEIEPDRWWMRAHTKSADIVPASWTWVQDQCDQSAAECVHINDTSAEFFEHDVRFGMFDVTRGYLPGQRQRILEDLSGWLKKQGGSRAGSDVSWHHDDGSFSWRAVDSEEWVSVSAVSSRMRVRTPYFFRQGYRWDGCNMELVRFKMHGADVFRQICKQKSRIAGGRIPFGASLLPAAALEQGEGGCCLCEAQAVYNVEHLFECTGDRFAEYSTGFNEPKGCGKCGMSCYWHRQVCRDILTLRWLRTCEGC